MFESEAIKKIVTEQLAQVPEDHKIAVVAVTNGDSAKLVFAYKPDEHGHWIIDSFVQFEKNHGFDYGASVQWSR